MIASCGTTRRPEAAQPRSVFSAVAASVCDGLRKQWVAFGMNPRLIESALIELLGFKRVLKETGNGN